MSRYGWARGGDVNAFFGLMLDNVAVLLFLFNILTLPGGYSAEFVLTRMIPGTALGVLFGDLVYTWMAFRLAERSGRSDITAMPLGLDTPSTIGMGFFVLRPALTHGAGLGMDHDEAMLFGWRVSVVVLLYIGAFKVLFAPTGNAIRRWVPQAGLLGSLAAIALVLISFLPLLNELAPVPIVGMAALVIILITLVAHRSLPFRFPGALAAVLIGLGIYWLGHRLGQELGIPVVPPPERKKTPEWSVPPLFSVFLAQADEWKDVFAASLRYLPVAVPFALATIVGGIDCTESAAAAGDEYDTRTILLTEGITSVLAACLGGVSQTTPYIGHPAYKAMGGRAAYTLATALFIGAAGFFGWFAHLFEWLPKAAMVPILVFVGIEITAHSFRATKPRHYAALALAILPALAQLISIPLGDAYGGVPPHRIESQAMLLTLTCLANGFIVTSLLWAAALAAILDGKLTQAALWLCVAAVFALVGIIHSPLPGSPIMLPVDAFERMMDKYPVEPRFTCQSPYHWCGAYVLCALLLIVLSFFRAEQPKAVETEA